MFVISNRHSKLVMWFLEVIPKFHPKTWEEMKARWALPEGRAGSLSPMDYNRRPYLMPAHEREEDLDVIKDEATELISQYLTQGLGAAQVSIIERVATLMEGHEERVPFFILIDIIRHLKSSLFSAEELREIEHRSYQWQTEAFKCLKCNTSLVSDQLVTMKTFQAGIHGPVCFACAQPTMLTKDFSMPIPTRRTLLKKYREMQEILNAQNAAATNASTGEASADADNADNPHPF